MSTTASAAEVAAALRARLGDIGVLKLHKLLYYCQAHHLAAFGEPLFAEPIVAWDNGPVVASIWRDEHYERFTPADRGAEIIDERSLNTIGYVVSTYGALSGTNLINMTHSEPPWKDADARRQSFGTKDETISVGSIESYFKSAPADKDDVPLLSDEAVTDWLAKAGKRRATSADAPPDSMDSLKQRLQSRAG